MACDINELLSNDTITNNDKATLIKLNELTESVEDSKYGSDVNSEQKVRYESLGKDIHKDMKKILKLNSNLSKLPDAPSAEHQAHITEVLEAFDTDFLNEVDLYLNTEAEHTSGIFDASKMSMYLNLNTRNTNTAGNAKSAMEVHAHELIHAFTAYALSLKDMSNHTTIKQLWNLFHLAEKSVTWEHFLPKDSIDPIREEKIAKATYKYIFNNSNSNGLHEFIAHGLTNESLVTYLKTLAVSDSFNKGEEASSLLGLLKKVWSTLMSIILGNVKFTHRDSNVYESLLGLTLSLSETNNKAINKVMKNDSLFTQMFRKVNIANKKGENLIKKVSEYIDDKKIPQMPKDGNVFQQAYFLTRYAYKLIGDPKLRPELEKLMTALGINPEGAITNILKDMRSPDALDDVVEMLGYANGKIEEEKVLIEKAAKGNILEMFKEKLSRKSREVLSLGVLDIDLSSIATDYTSEELSTILKDKDKRRKEIGRLENILNEDKEFGRWYVTQAKGLGWYMVKHEAGVVQNFNADGIARLVHSGFSQSKPSARLIGQIDTLATLYGIEFNTKEVNNEVARLLDTDPEGMEKFMYYHHTFKKESKKVLFNNKAALMIKGYAKELTDNTIEVKIMPVSMRAEMENEGFELVSEAKKSPLDTSIEPMGVYKSKAFVSQGYNPGVTRITDLGRRGTTLGDIRYKGNEAYQKVREQKDIAVLKRVQRQTAKDIMEGKYNREADLEAGLTPVINEKYGLSTFRYLMSKEAKRDLLEQDVDGVEVLARMHSNMYDKSKTDEQNNKVLEVILSDQEDNYVKGEVYGNNRREYIVISEDSHVDEVRDIYALLPKSFKEAVVESGKAGIAVRRDMLHAYFGFKEATILNAGAFGIYFNEVAPKELQTLIRLVEGYWKELVKISKVDIIIRIPSVLIGNVISNAFYSVQSGNNPIKVLSKTIENFKAVHEYIQLRNEHELQVQKSKNGDSKAKQSAANIEAQLKGHPLHTLMEAGLYQSVQTEEIGQDDMKSTNKFSKKIDSLTENVPGFVKSGLHWLYLSEKTSFFKTMTTLTQYSDVVARVTEYQFLTEQGATHESALKTVINAFVNYNKVSSSKEDWLNKIGLLMFTKYFKRTQRSLQYLVEKKPVSFMYSMLLQEFTGNIPDIGEQNLLSKNYMGMVHNPIENLTNAVVPSSIELVLGSEEINKYISQKDIKKDESQYEYLAYRRETAVTEVLKDMMKHTDTTKDEKRIASLLIHKVSKDAKLLMLQDNKYEHAYNMNTADGAYKDSLGFYDDVDNKVVIRGTEVSAHVLLHEIGHMVLKEKLNKDSKEKKVLLEIMDRLKKDSRIVKGVDTYWDSKTNTGTYAFHNLDEFVSEAISNPSIIAMLKASDTRNGTGLRNAIRRTVMKLVGDDTQHGNSFEKLIFNIESLSKSS